MIQFKATSPHGVPPFQREEEIELLVNIDFKIAHTYI